jgi:L-fuconolactonase
MTRRIDAHVHLWNRVTDPQEWIDPVSMAPIDRDFGSTDLEAMLASTHMEAAVLVQAGNSLEESARLAHSDPRLVAGLVAWVDLHRDIGAQLARIRDGATVPVVGVRHLVHMDPDPRWLLLPGVSRGLEELARHGLTFDLVVRDWQLQQAARVIRAHPDLTFVLDHLGGPLAEDAELDRWESGLRAVAANDNVVVKLSGLASGMDAGQWVPEDLRDVVSTTVDVFGTHRLLYGSDWPLVELGGGAPTWLAAVQELLAGLSDHERSAVFGGAATAAYDLGLG